MKEVFIVSGGDYTPKVFSDEVQAERWRQDAEKVYGEDFYLNKDFIDTGVNEFIFTSYQVQISMETGGIIAKNNKQFIEPSYNNHARSQFIDGREVVVGYSQQSEESALNIAQSFRRIEMHRREDAMPFRHAFRTKREEVV